MDKLSAELFQMDFQKQLKYIFSPFIDINEICTVEIYTVNIQKLNLPAIKMCQNYDRSKKLPCG